MWLLVPGRGREWRSRNRSIDPAFRGAGSTAWWGCRARDVHPPAPLGVGAAGAGRARAVLDWLWLLFGPLRVLHAIRFVVHTWSEKPKASAPRATSAGTTARCAAVGFGRGPGAGGRGPGAGHRRGADGPPARAHDDVQRPATKRSGPALVVAAVVALVLVALAATVYGCSLPDRSPARDRTTYVAFTAPRARPRPSSSTAPAGTADRGRRRRWRDVLVDRVASRLVPSTPKHGRCPAWTAGDRPPRYLSQAERRKLVGDRGTAGRRDGGPPGAGASAGRSPPLPRAVPSPRRWFEPEPARPHHPPVVADPITRQ